VTAFSLQKKNILITGASSGIGASCCKLLSEQGANIILIGRNSERLLHTFNTLKEGNHYIHEMDLTEISEIEKELTPILLKYQQIHGYIHSAGIDITLPFKNLMLKHYQEIFTTNVYCGLEIAKVLSKNKYLPENGSSFIFLSSIAGVNGVIGKAAYSASKGALISVCRSLALELASKKIRVNCISPAIVETKMVKELFLNLTQESIDNIINSHPLGLGKPEDIAYACIYLLSEEARWITGSNLIIDGGYSIQ
jgi:NAD(P)-dependent dehydrogenase (short-subunit alcohol dehydrogenase family)